MIGDCPVGHDIRLARILVVVAAVGLGVSMPWVIAFLLSLGRSTTVVGRIG